MNSQNFLKILLVKNSPKSLYKKSSHNFPLPYNNHNNILAKWRTVNFLDLMHQILQTQLIKFRLFDEKKWLTTIGERFKIPKCHQIILEKRLMLEKSMNMTLLGRRYSYSSTELTKINPEIMEKFNGKGFIQMKKISLDTIKRNVTEVLESNEVFLAKKYGKLAIQHSIKAAGKLFEIVQKEMKKQKSTEKKV